MLELTGSNNFRAQFDGSIASDALTITLKNIVGEQPPAVPYPLTLVKYDPDSSVTMPNGLTLYEEVKVERVLVTDDSSWPQVTVTRGWMGDDAEDFSDNDYVEIRTDIEYIRDLYTGFAGIQSDVDDVAGDLATLEAALPSTYQPLDAQLTALAGLSYGSNGLKVIRVNAGENGFEFATISVGGGDLLAANNLSDLANASTALTNLGLTANGKSLVTAANYAAMLVLLGISANVNVRNITFVIDGGGSAITTGVKGDLTVPFGCTINQVTLLADQSGSIVIDIWKDTYANFPPTVADTITASAKPTISAATKAQDGTLTGWTTSITAGDTLRFNVDSITTVTRVTLSLKVTQT